MQSHVCARWVREEIAEEVLVMEESREKACVVRTLKAKDEIAIYAEQVCQRFCAYSVLFSPCNGLDIDRPHTG